MWLKNLWTWLEAKIDHHQFVDFAQVDILINQTGRKNWTIPTNQTTNQPTNPPNQPTKPTHSTNPPTQLTNSPTNPPTTLEYHFLLSTPSTGCELSHQAAKLSEKSCRPPVQHRHVDLGCGGLWTTTGAQRLLGMFIQGGMSIQWGPTNLAALEKTCWTTNHSEQLRFRTQLYW